MHPCCSYAPEDNEAAAESPLPAAESPLPAAPRTTQRRSRRAPTTGTKRSAEAAELPAPEPQPAPAERPRRQAAAAFLASMGAEHAVGGEGQESAAQPAPAARTRRSMRAAAGGEGNGLLLVAQAAEAAAAAEQQAVTAEQQAAEQHAVPAEQQVAEGSGGEGSTSALPEHLQEVRQQVAAAQEKNRQRIAGQRRPNGKPKDFAVGDAVLLLPPKCGKVGSMVGAKRVICRVVGITCPFGKLRKYQLRCNAGVLKETYPSSKLDKAVPALACHLSFDGVEVAGVPVVTAMAALQAERSRRGGGSTVTACGCRGACGKGCKCKKHGVLCGRHCGCAHGKGGACGNDKH